MNLSNYYLGFIQLNPFIYNRIKARRMIGEINYDPFCEEDILTGMIQGMVVLLRKENDIYYDEYSSRYKNEIKYKLNETNEYGIRLAYIKPFQELYQEKPLTLIKEKTENNYEVLEELFYTREYYISHSTLDGSDAIVIIDDEKADLVREEYYDKYYRTPYHSNNEKQK